MTWHTHYLTEGAGAVARVIDTLPYHGPLLLSTNKTELSGARLSNLKCALRAERERSTEVTNEPYHLVLDVSDICNLKCPLCVQATEPRGRKRTTLTVASAIKALSAFPGAVLRVEFFNWGEPFLNPEFLTIAQFADTAGIFSRTSSHFSIRNLPDANAIIDSGLKWVVLSIDGVTQETYEKYRVGGKLRQVLVNLERRCRPSAVAAPFFRLSSGNSWRYDTIWTKFSQRTTAPAIWASMCSDTAAPAGKWPTGSVFRIRRIIPNQENTFWTAPIRSVNTTPTGRSLTSTSTTDVAGCGENWPCMPMAAFRHAGLPGNVISISDRFRRCHLIGSGENRISPPRAPPQPVPGTTPDRPVFANNALRAAPS